VDTRARKLAGWLVVAVGVVIALVGALADQIGLGNGGPDKFGGKQVAALVVGLVIAVVGLVIALMPQRSPEAVSGSGVDGSVESDAE
jgi:hypothetical protein